MRSERLLFPPGATRHDWVLDAALAAGLGLLTVPPYGVRGFADRRRPPGCSVSALLMIGSLVLRRHSPLLALAGVTLAGLMQLVLSPDPMATLVAVPVVAYSVARWMPGRPARIVLVVGAIGVGARARSAGSLDDPSHPSIRDLIWLMLAWFVCMGLVVTPYAVGRRVRESSEAHLRPGRRRGGALPHDAHRAGAGQPGWPSRGPARRSPASCTTSSPTRCR